ncbi:MAG: ribonuclease M5 [Tissierellia bacterium]|nr:ribonuclease M5 [Tissierellia bacterium]
MKIKEVIVVEGKDDIRAVKSALDCQVIATGGSYISEETLDTIKNLNDRVGVIVLTDPDYAGKKIRNEVSKVAPGCKHAFILRDRATKKGDIGVENASSDEIIRAIKRARPELKEDEYEYGSSDLSRYGLSGFPDSKKRRIILCDILGIGYGNSKQLLKRLSGYGIKREEFERAAEEMLKRLKSDVR